MKEQVKVYYIEHNKLNTENESLLSEIMPRYRNQVLESKNDGRRKNALSSGLLLSRILHFTEDSQVVAGEHGALRSADTKGPTFCISHGRDFTILAVSRTGIPLGCDIEEFPNDEDAIARANLSQEKLKRHRFLVAKRTFPETLRIIYEEAIAMEEEDYLIHPCSKCGEAHTFTRMWTIVEAVLKAEGSGFATDPVAHPELFIDWQTNSVMLAEHIITVAMPLGIPFEMECIPLSV